MAYVLHSVDTDAHQNIKQMFLDCVQKTIVEK